MIDDVNETRGTTSFRVCPTVQDAVEAPLFRQVITEDTCFGRQGRGYHKCCKCQHFETKRAVNGIRAVSLE